jgi:hypothetical protein
MGKNAFQLIQGYSVSQAAKAVLNVLGTVVKDKKGIAS